MVRKQLFKFLKPSMKLTAVCDWIKEHVNVMTYIIL